MKTYFIILFLFPLMVSHAWAQQKNENFSISKNYKASTWTISNDSEKMKLVIKGDVQLSDDDQNIKSITPGGSVSYTKGNQKLYVSADSKGNLEYKINDAKTRVTNVSEYPIIGDCVSTLIGYGVDAQRRAKRIYATSGFPGFINEVSRLKSEYAKEIYLSFVLKNEKLSNDGMSELLGNVNNQLQNDYYKSVTLSAINPSYLSNEKVADQFIKAIEDMGSGYYRYTTLQKIMKAPLTENQFEKVISMSDKINSDYYQSEILKTALQNKSLSPQNLSQIMNAAVGIKSDYYQSEVLKQVSKSGVKDENVWKQLIKLSGNLHSDYYLSEVLVLIAKKMPSNDLLLKEVEDTAKNINSDYYYGKVIRAIKK